MEKFDLFIATPPRRPYAGKKIAESITTKILVALAEILEDKGVDDITISSDLLHPEIDGALTEEELKFLLANRIYISEHYISRNLNFEVDRIDNGRVYTSPFSIRPAIQEYNFCNDGKPSVFHFAICGLMNSGKSLLIKYLRDYLEKIVPAEQIVLCANEFYVPGAWEFLKDVDFMRHYESHFKSRSILMGGAPRVMLDVKDVPHNNVKTI